MGISSRITRLTAAIRQAFFRLNEKQRTSIAGALEKLATGAMIPVAFKLMSDGETGDGFAIFMWLICAILFQIAAVVALATKEDGDDQG